MRTHGYVIAGEPVDIHVVEDAQDVRAFQDWAAGHISAGRPVAFDTETSGLDIFSADYRLRLAQFGDQRTAWVLPVERGRLFADAARRVLLDLPRVVIHHAAFDWLVADRCLGVPLEHLYPRTVDTKIMATLVDPRQAQEGGVGTGLKPLSAHYIDPAAPDTQEDLTRVFRSLGLTKAAGFAGIPLDHPTYETYAGLDVLLTARLLYALNGVHAELGIRPTLLEYEHRIAFICAHMQRTGLLCDVEYTKALSDRLHAQAEEFEHKARRYGVESINSPKQVADALLGMGETLTERTAGGALRVDKAVLLALADLNTSWERLGARTPNPLADAVIRSKRAGKWKSAYADTFLQTLDAEGRVHPFIHSLAARTGRMSITRPALQTLPGRDVMIRRAILADEGHVMISCDFDAVEMRVMAALADVRRMKAAILAGEDLHSYTRSLVYGDAPDPDGRLRALCKGIGFGKIFGGGASGVARMTGADEGAVRSAMRTYDHVFPEIKRASNTWQREAMANGMITTTVTGRRLPLDRDRTYAVVNYQVQSAARDCLGQALCDMQDAGVLDYLRLPVHDEVLVSAPAEDAQDIARAVEKAMNFDLYGVPITASADIGKRSWGSLKGGDY
ncbi:DNA polymerase [Streptomyces luteoverticillatus]|uniref:DNA polymerase I n=1 Tax=Streptomyces luteoverticillatus TaxID=66425 RepID=A0A3S9PCW1_STRLT|nr:DNA polymerase [Streptomyces luteoverticillatus]AZQ70277.1 DNA polymerase [Streptomyces luteoverticillatus]